MAAASPDDLDTPEDRLAALLATYDEALAAGLVPAPETGGSGRMDRDSLDRLGQDRRVVALLERVWPRRLSGPDTADQAGSPAGGAPGPLLRLGRFEVVRELGRGGFGVVYLATDPLLRRPVAVKVPRPEALFTPELRERFLREARAAAGLSHPQIVPVFDSGEVGTLCYLVSAYCPGGTLAAYLRGRSQPLPARAAAALVAVLADAVQHAHARGILHRDLKPGNVLLECPPDSVPAEADLGAVLRLADFGLAKFLEGEAAGARDPPAAGPARTDAPGQTASGAMLGTPQYMAPEQAAGQSERVGPATDVYALGVLLYEVLTGRPPFRGDTDADTLRQVRDDEPLPPGRLRPGLSRDLETICLKCLHKEPAKRYASARELGEDLRRFLRGEGIRARRAGLPERVGRWARRRPALAVLMALGVLAVPALLLSGLLIERRLAATRARGLVTTLLAADPEKLPHALAELDGYRRLAEPELREVAAHSPADSPEHLRASLALLPSDGSQAGYLQERLWTAGPAEVGLIRDALAERWPAQAPRLWATLTDPDADPGRRLRAACILAAADRDGQGWRQSGDAVVSILLAEDPLAVSGWTGLLRPVRAELTVPLREAFDNRSRPEQSHVAAAVLAEYCSEDLEALLDADAVQFRYLFARLPAGDGRTRSRLRAKLTDPAAARPTGPEKARLVRRQANAAVALLRLGGTPGDWELLRHRDDPQLRTYLLHRLGPMGVDVRAVAGQLERQRDDSIRRALILALGEYDNRQVTAVQRQALVARLREWYRDDPDAGIHSAAEWLLRRWGQEEALRRLDGAAARLPAPAGFRWCRTAEGHTLAMLLQPCEFQMGSPADEPHRAAGEDLRRCRLAPFAIATRTTTLAQFRRYRPGHAQDPPPGPESDYPVTGVDFREAAWYCNWLSQQEGIPPDQWCYVASAEPADVGIRPRADWLSRGGYRLPTEAEWEYACRAGAVTSRFYGHADDMLASYGWSRPDAREQPGPVAQLKPNDLGLFEPLGNVWEWASDWQNPDDHRHAVLRGATFRFAPRGIRAAGRFVVAVTDVGERTGFRVARSLVGDRRSTVPVPGEGLLMGKRQATTADGAASKRQSVPGDALENLFEGGTHGESVCVCLQRGRRQLAQNSGLR
jgi:formylglycine-generating enzyme required for sulfatase activity